LIRLLEWGYNSDNLDLPQINLSVILNKEGDIPLSYEIYPCSVNDVETLQDTVKRLHAMEFDQTQIVEVLVRSDRGCGIFLCRNLHTAQQQARTREAVLGHTIEALNRIASARRRAKVEKISAQVSKVQFEQLTVPTTD
jgi:hypothetical protein